MDDDVKPFRFAANEKETLLLKRELNDVALASLKGIATKRGKDAARPVPESLRISRELMPNFARENRFTKRTSHPFFHDDDVRPKSPRMPIHKAPNIPTYNPLDKTADPNLPQKKTKKFPYQKDKKITVTEMQQPKATSVGVLPASRMTAEVNDLNVFLEAKSHVASRRMSDVVSISAVKEANVAAAQTPVPSTLPEEPVLPVQNVSLKPAILGATGTMQQLCLQEKPRLSVPKASTLKPPAMRKKVDKKTARRGSAPVTASSLGLSEGDLTRSGSRSYSRCSEDSLKSASDLLEEARSIGRLDGRDAPAPPSSTTSSRKEAEKSHHHHKKRRKHHKGAAGSEEVGAEGGGVTERKVRTVDEIISSLKQGADQADVVSESDRKIQEIMGRVMKHANAVLAEIGEDLKDEEEEEQTEEPGEVDGKKGEELSPPDDDLSQHVEGQEVGSSEEQPTMEPAGDGTVGRSPQKSGVSVKGASSSAKSGVSRTQTRNSHASGSLVDEADAGGDGDIRRIDSRRSGTLPPFDDSPTGPTPVFDEQAERIAMETVSMDDLDLRQAYHDIMLSSDVEYSDIIHIYGRMEKLSNRMLFKSSVGVAAPFEKEKPRKRFSPVKGHRSSQLGASGKVDQSEPEAPAQSTALSFVSQYGRAKIERAVVEQAVKPRDKYVRNSHLFCTLREGVQMPRHLADLVKLHHTPDAFKATLGNYKVEPEHVEQFAVSQRTARDQRIEEDRSRIAAAIMEEAEQFSEKTSPGQQAGSLDQWASRANQVFKEDFEVHGTQMNILDDETRLFWQPAPPKMGMAPAAVRDHLFGSYFGLTQPQPGPPGSRGSGLSGMEMGGPGEGYEDLREMEESEEEEEEEQELELEDETAAQYRTLQRRHHSHQDLTHLLKTQVATNGTTEPQPRLGASDFLASIRKQGDLAKSASLVSFEDGSVAEGTRLVGSGGRAASAASGSTWWLPTDITPSGLHLSLKSHGRTDGSPSLALPKHRKTCGSPVPVNKKVLSDDHIFPVSLPLRRCLSVPGSMGFMDDFVCIPESYSSAMGEVERQKAIAEDIKAGQMRALNESRNQTQAKDTTEQQSLLEARMFGNYRTAVSPGGKRRQDSASKKTLAELALEAGRNYIVYPRKKAKESQPIDMARLEAVERFLYEDTGPPPECRRSIQHLPRGRPEKSLRVPQRLRSRRRRSLPSLLKFVEFSSQRVVTDEEEEPEREWVRGIWNSWFDEVFPPTPAESEYDGEEYDVETTTDDRSSASTKLRHIITDEELMKMDPLDMFGENDKDQRLVEALEEEAEKVTARIESTVRPISFDFCRRGAIYRKLGNLAKARQDLDRAVLMEPSLLHAYWQRHLIYILQGKTTDALEDLNSVLKINRGYADAYVSRANILKDMDVTMAITNLDTAINLKGNNATTFLRRAELHEQRGQVRLAMEDYARAYRLDPKCTEAIFKRGSFYFEQKNWQASVNDFSELLKKTPQDSKARLLRGRAYSKLEQWQKAVRDLSAVVHLEPDSWEAFYYRGCIFRKVAPRQALSDFSISILLNDGEDNIKSLLHRGILYDSTDRPEEAILDFEAILKLRLDVAVAHLNLGLIYLLKMESYPKAIRKFTAAIKCDPTYVRAYVCRAEAHVKMHQNKLALLDYYRAIHLRPDVPHYYMHRGQLLLKLGQTELASFCVKHVSELFVDTDLGQSATQQAVVHSFLTNYEKAISALEGAIRVGPDAHLYILLGKTQMKAKLWQDSLKSLKSALDLLRPWKPGEKWPKVASEINHLMGMCCLELRNYLGAHEAFSLAIEKNKQFAEAFYQRGVARLRLKQAKGMLDINRSLALDPTIFQAFLTRAAYYGAKGKYPKAILNCNEAIKLKPKTVRGYLYRGALKYHIRAYHLAIRDLTMATRIDSMCALAYFNRGVCYQESGEYERALADYGIVLLLGDQLVLKVLINRGILYLTHGDYKNALQDFLLAAQVNPRDYKTRHTLGLCMHKLKRLDEAVATFTEALRLEPFFLEALVSRGNANLDRGTPVGTKEALSDYQKALRLRPTYLPAHINIAYALQASGRFQQAWEHFTTAAESFPRCRAAYEGRAVVSLQMGSLFAALQDMNASLNVEVTAEGLTNRGVINQFMRDNQGAMHDFQAAITKDAKFSLAYFNAANMYFTMRQYRQAITHYTAAIEHDPRDESARVNRAIARVMTKDHDGALEDFSAAASLSPLSAHVYFNRAALRAVRGEWASAEADYTEALQLLPDDPVTYKRRADARGKLGKKVEAVADYKYAIELQSRTEYLRRGKKLKAKATNRAF